MPQTSRSNASPLIPEEVRKKSVPKVKWPRYRFKPPGRRKRVASNGRFT